MSGHRTKGEHYIPRAAYLEHFADDSQKKPVVWVYKFDNNLALRIEEAKGIPPRQICKETYLYESPTLPVNSIERMLESIEVTYHDILRNKILDKKPLTDEEKRKVALFVTTLEARLPTMRDNLQGNLTEIESMVQSMEEQFANGEETETHRDIKKAKDSIFADGLLIAAELNILQHLDFLFLENRTFHDPSVGGFFITSDRPVMRYDFTFMNSFAGIPPLSDTIEVIVPLTPRVALFANNRGLSGFEDINPNFIMELNNRILYYSRGRIFAPHPLSAAACDRMLGRSRQSFILEYMRREESRDSGQA